MSIWGDVQADAWPPLLISTWLAHTSKGQLPNMGGKERPDVSFLQEKGSTLVSGNAAKKMAIESSQGVLLS